MSQVRGKVVLAVAAGLLGCDQTPAPEDGTHLSSAGRHPQWILTGLAHDSQAINSGLESMTLHDAQKVVFPQAGGYGALYRATLTSETADPVLPGDANHVATVEVVGTPHAESPYRQGFTCVYMSRTTSGVSALLTPATESTCAPPEDAYESLMVRVVREKRPNEVVLPSVRWHSAPDGTRLVLGLSCMDDWCAIGEDGAGFEADKANPLFGHNDKNHFSPAMYDDQLLAIGTAGNLRPGRMRARVYPHRDLEEVADDEFEDEWVPVATIEIQRGNPADFASASSQYQGNWDLKTSNGADLRPGPLDRIDVWLRRDGERWSGRFKGPKGSFSHRFVVKRMDPQAVTKARETETRTIELVRRHGPLGSARWGWSEEDETVWVRCGSGCCELTFTRW
jgi:hypothetical protein